MKRTNLVLAGVMLSGVLAGCAEETAPKPREEVKGEQVVAVSNDAKEWKDVSQPEGFNKYGIEPTLHAWIAYHAKDIVNTADVNEYLTKITNITTENARFFRIQGEDLQKDFTNLGVLGTAINHFEYVIGEQKREGIGTAETTEDLNKAITYFTELLHDLDIIINQNGEGEVFGITNQLDGQKVTELEAFLY